MFQSARHRSPMTPRWVRGLMTGAFLVVISTSHLGCGLDYVYRNISPLHPTGWSFVWPILPSQQQRLEEDIKREHAETRLGEMLVGLVKAAEKKRIKLAPFIGIGCPGFIEHDGSIDRGAQNLPGNWESKNFNLPGTLHEMVPRSAIMKPRSCCTTTRSCRD